MLLPSQKFTAIALLLASLPVLHVLAQDLTPPKPSLADARSRIKKTGEHEYELGEIKFNSTTREISFPAAINMADGTLEYALVHETGKTHESLLKTKIKGFDLNVVMLLCHYEPHIGELTSVLSEVRPELLAEAKKPLAHPGAQHVDIHVKWKDARGEHHLKLQEMVTALSTNKTLTAPYFTYNGSELVEGYFEADREGSYIALYIDFIALINSIEKNNINDKNWIVNQTVTPPVDTPVTVILTPGENPPAPSASKSS